MREREGGSEVSIVVPGLVSVSLQGILQFYFITDNFVFLILFVLFNP